MTKNYIFRKFKCGLSKAETAKLCFKSVRTITGWDDGKEIPPECKRLMRMYTNRQLNSSEEWNGFSISKGMILLPTGNKLTAPQLLTAAALLEIDSDLEIKTKTKLLKFVRALVEIKIKYGK